MTAPKSTILLVDDDPECRRLVADLLRCEGGKIEPAESVSQQNEALSRVRPDLLILDVMLTGGDSLSISRRLRADATLPILMLTAKSDEIDRVAGLQMATDDAGETLTPTSGAFEQLTRFVRRPRRERSCDRQLDWPREGYADLFDQTVDRLISRRRRRLEAGSSGGELIGAARTSGYLFTPQVKALS